MIIKSILKNWNSVFGLADQFLSDNCGEFANEKFMEMCESLSINFKTTSAEFLWSNGLIERHNLILSKILEESKCSFEVTLAWCTNGKNSLQNVHGFSPFQLALGQNPKLSSMINDKPSAYTPHSSSKLLMDNLNAINKLKLGKLLL